MNKEEFKNYVNDELGIILTQKQIDQLDLFARLLLDYNERINITAIRNISDVYLKHFYDSLTLVKGVDLNKEMSVLDLGSGGGFPGIVLKIVFPKLKITLLDSNHKKSDFQSFIINELNLDNIFVINMRAEDYFKKGYKYDLVVARAVANLSVLSELCIPFVKINGLFIAMKGNYLDEIVSGKKAISILGANMEDIIEFKIPINYDNRALLLIRKIKETPNTYPRNFNQILKKPLGQ